MELAKLAADLREAARHVHDWEAAPRIVDPLIEELDDLRLTFDCEIAATLERVASNLAAALNMVVSRPAVLKGYLLGGAEELESAAREAKEVEADG